jgi:hypothetical protein
VEADRVAGDRGLWVVALAELLGRFVGGGMLLFFTFVLRLRGVVFRIPVAATGLLFYDILLASSFPTKHFLRLLSIL